MTADGKMLESLVAFVEETLLPPSFDVKTNTRVYKENGVQIAEFDVEIRGKMGSTDIAWLIECRDRPSDGKQSGDWIEQLVGRRGRFLFNKVTAVSTTGFTEGARDYAKQSGVELREVRSLTPDEFRDWLQIRSMMLTERRSELISTKLIVSDGEAEERQAALLEVLTTKGNEPILKSSATGKESEIRHAMLAVLEKNEAMFDTLEPNGPSKKAVLNVSYTNDDDHFVVETAAGPIRIQKIIFQANLSLIEREIPLSVTAEYSGAEGEEGISQYAAFEPFEARGASIVMEMHRMSESGETHVVIRKLGDAKAG